MLVGLFWLSIGLVAYTYAGYPMLLWLVARLRRKPVHPVLSELPAVTLVISAYNERSSIRAKILNSLAIDYPALDILVVSDASDDGTDEIAAEYESNGVRVLRMVERGGKTVGLNRAAETARGDVLVFSDANAMYERGAIRALVAPFADPRVGAVVGESTYEDPTTSSQKSEGLYWQYEVWLKEMESRVGSVVGGDGAIYAVRRELYSPMAADALSDFVNPLQVVKQGYRCLYERGARSVEEAAPNFEKEFRRKVRIVNRAWRATVRLRGMLNPLAYGWFAIALVSHKLLRWLVPVFLICALTCSTVLATQSAPYAFLLGVQLLFYGTALAAGVFMRGRDLPALIYVPFYFCLVNAASLLGIWQAFQGATYTTWNTSRAS